MVVMAMMRLSYVFLESGFYRLAVGGGRQWPPPCIRCTTASDEAPHEAQGERELVAVVLASALAARLVGIDVHDDVRRRACAEACAVGNGHEHRLGLQHVLHERVGIGAAAHGA